MVVQSNVKIEFCKKNILVTHFVKMSKEYFEDDFVIPCKQHTGFKDFLFKIKSGLDTDDFIKNLVTVVAYFKRYKKPRFIKSKTISITKKQLQSGKN